MMDTRVLLNQNQIYLNVAMVAILIVMTAGGAWWASDISTRQAIINERLTDMASIAAQNAQTLERMARIETELKNLTKTIDAFNDNKRR